MTSKVEKDVAPAASGWNLHSPEHHLVRSTSTELNTPI